MATAREKSEIFRKASLDRLSSPEQLDLMLNITSSGSWIALWTLFGVLGAGLVWGFAGSTTTTVNGQGVLLRSGGLFNLVAMGSGKIAEIRVKPGDNVEPGEVVALIDQPDLEEKLANAREQLEMAERSGAAIIRTNQAGDQAKLVVMEKQRSAIEQEIRDTQSQLKFAKDQVTVDQQLNGRGLITKQTMVTDQEKVASLDLNIVHLQAQLEQLQADEVSMKNQQAINSVNQGTKLSDQRRTIEDLEQQLKRSSEVISHYTGRVVEIQSYVGAVAAAGSSVVSIEPARESLELDFYVPARLAKEVKPGMLVRVSPSGVKREEYGYAIGKVASVSDFPATSEAVGRLLENQTLVASFLGNEPVMQVQAMLIADSRTESGFKWSSAKGPPTQLTTGSVCGAEVVTREDPPISLVIPYLKKTFSLD